MYVDYARRYVVYPLLLITVNITSHSVVLLVLEYAGATASQKDNDNDNLFNFYTNTLHMLLRCIHTVYQYFFKKT